MMHIIRTKYENILHKIMFIVKPMFIFITSLYSVKRSDVTW